MLREGSGSEEVAAGSGREPGDSVTVEILCGGGTESPSGGGLDVCGGRSRMNLAFGPPEAA
jgi:hypothetical protein